ncbi:ABC transporter ATP-binding protein [Croceiramulus getboli]|nr:ABC transporter ATP-binding protein [Flavobacteriaceae bacterium YJPT1-3]
MQANPLLTVHDLTLGFQAGKSFTEVLHAVSFDLFSNEILAIVGESGSGKSVTALAVLGLLPKKQVRLTNGSITFKGQDLLTATPKELRKLRGNALSMIFQEPMSSLNPSMRCGQQVMEVLLRHQKITAQEARAETLSLFKQVKLPRPESLLNSYPHELSGGQKQRVMIAMAIACKPDILIADEPTTALDVTVQKDILLLLKSLQSQYGMSIIFISHDLDLVSDIADRVLVMYQGKVVESASAKAIFQHPQHPYTRALLNARPKMTERRSRLPTIQDFLEDKNLPPLNTREQRVRRHHEIYSQPPLLEVRNASKTFFTRVGFFRKPQAIQAVDSVSLKVYEGETLGLVGESGSGKSTLGNLILQLDQATSGEILYRGKSLNQLSSRQIRGLRKELQLIFQDPFSSLNPRLTVGQAISEPMLVHQLYPDAQARKERVLYILNRVGLKAEHYDRYPHEFSGGQRQRIGIARTIAVAPKLIICDESVSALDISVQAQVLNLLNELKEDFGFTYIFISHDLAVVKYMADQLVVLQNGKKVEQGEADAVYANPQEAYTQALIEAIPKKKF